MRKFAYAVLKTTSITDHFFFLCALIFQQLLQHLRFHSLYRHSSLKFNDGFSSRLQKYLSLTACRHILEGVGFISSKSNKINNYVKI